MYALYRILLVVHIAAAAVTLGASVGLMRHLRRTLEASQQAFALAAEDAQRRGKIMGLSGFIVLQTGLALIFVIGGFKAAPLNIHIAFMIMLGAMALSITVMRPTSARLVDLSKAETLDKVGISKSLKKLAMGQGILHLAWIIILVLMLVRIEK